MTCPYQRAGAIRLSVTDSGAGLSPEQLQRIFGEGVQFNANTLQAGQGSGLGLFITKGIVEKHQGTIKVHSDGLGTGTTFTVELPLFFVTSQPGSNFGARKIGPECDNVNLFPPLHDCPQTLSAEVFAQILAEHPIKNVLVVDDTVSNRKMLIRLLKNRGCTCVEAGNGQEALDVYNDALKGEELSFGLEPFDAILMDYEMPVKNGPQATKELREKGCAGFIVGITGNVLPSDIQFFKDHGVDAVLPKPLEIDLLLHEWAQFKANSLRIDIFPTPITTKLNCSSDTQSGKTEFQLEDVYAADSSFL